MNSRLVLSETDHHAEPAETKKARGQLFPQILPEIEGKPISSNGLLYYLPPPLDFQTFRHLFSHKDNIFSRKKSSFNNYLSKCFYL